MTGHALRRVALLAGLLASPGALAEDASLQIARPWARATAESARAGGVFMTITGAQADRLVGGRSPVAEKVELHTHINDNGVMRMRPVEGGIPVEPGRATELKPGGLHVMLMGLKRPLREGETFTLDLTFERVGTRTVTVTVEKAGAMQSHGAMSGHRP